MTSMEKPLQNIDFLAIGDIVTDTFIQLQDAEVHCNIDDTNCTISMRFGDKIPYKDAHIIHGVGNSANAAVSAARLGLASGLVASVGNDELGALCINALQQNNVSIEAIKKCDGKNTNHHYVLQYGPERTILVKHESFTYELPNYPTSWVYLSSLATGTESFYAELQNYLEKNPDTQLAFQPGTFQMKMGVEQLKTMYQRSKIFFCNKEEAQRILEKPNADFKELHAGIRNLGPEYVVITDGPNGLTASHTNEIIWNLPMYPDPKPPIDRTGAGDACSSTIVAAMQLGIPFEQALLWGPINSMSVVQYIGAQEGLLSRKQIESYLQNAPSNYVLTELT